MLQQALRAAPMRLLSPLTYRLARMSTVLWRPMVGRRWLRMWAMVHTRGRHSGRRYSPPVQVRSDEDRLVVRAQQPLAERYCRHSSTVSCLVTLARANSINASACMA